MKCRHAQWLIVIKNIANIQLALTYAATTRHRPPTATLKTTATSTPRHPNIIRKTPKPHGRKASGGSQIKIQPPMLSANHIVTLTIHLGSDRNHGKPALRCARKPPPMSSPGNYPSNSHTGNRTPRAHRSMQKPPVADRLPSPYKSAKPTYDRPAKQHVHQRHSECIRSSARIRNDGRRQVKHQNTQNSSTFKEFRHFITSFISTSQLRPEGCPERNILMT